MKKYILLFLLASVSVFAQTESIVNTHLESDQRYPLIVADKLGNYAVVWQSENQVSSDSKYDIYMQRFMKDGVKIEEEILVNSNTSGEQERPSACISPLGDLVVSWASYENEKSIYDVKLKIIRSPISSMGGVDEFIVNSHTDNSQTKPSVAVSETGNIVVVWESWYQDGSNKGVYAQLLNSNGEKIGSEFRVNTTTLNSQSRPAVKYLDNGNFVVVWESWKQDIATPSGYGLFGKIFNPSGEVVTDEFQINTYTNDFQWFGDIAVLNDNTFAVVWCSWEQDGDDGGIYLQKFSSDGSKLSDEILINKTIVNYQWLPKVKLMPDNKIGVIWSSWLQDGSREGVFAKLLNPDLSPATFETQINEYTDSYQWEPDFIPTGVDEILAVWSSWGQVNNSYEIISREVQLSGPQAAIKAGSFIHPSGSTSSRFYVHVTDSTKLTGNEYELSFDIQNKAGSASVKNINTAQNVIQNFPVDKGEGVFYLTPEFEGIRVEIQPNFSFEIDQDRSYNVINSQTNLGFSIGKGFGSIVLAPIDIMIVWSSTDTLADGFYAYPGDNAYGQSGSKNVQCPFYAWNITDNEQMEMVVLEGNATKNSRWDPNENIGIITPQKYSTAFPRYHASLQIIKPAGQIVLPSFGDTNYIFTKRPLTSDDKFIFNTDKSLLTTDVRSNPIVPGKFSLEQNYPNPFNPTTTIVYSIPEESFVTLKIFDILGREVTQLVSDVKKKGEYKVLFNAADKASGIYFYSLNSGKKNITKKMLLVK